LITIAIIGMGMIGTSLGMALRNADEPGSRLGPLQISGFDRDRSSLNTARGRLAIDRVATSLADAVAGAQIVVLAVPVLAMRELLGELAALLPAGTIVTDVCSTKAQVMGWARELLPTTVDFVGGHPMAGRERSGPDAADPELLREAIYCLTVTPHTRPQAIEAVEAMVEAAGAKPYYIDAEEHDSYVAGVSHLPFLLSAALVDVASQGSAWREMQALAASGFRDVTRLASGSPEMHRDICMTNRAALRHWIARTVSLLDEVGAQLDAEDSAAIEALFRRAYERREEWLAAKPNMRPGEDAFLGGAPEVQRPSLFGFGPRKKK
jgi:prephenate dehydrogenase